MIWPIYVPTKGRPDSKLLTRLAKEDMPALAVLEPQDQEAYAAALPSVPLLVLPDSNRGITFSRNFLLDHARRAGHPWIWMLDDDVTGFSRFEGTKGRPVPAAEALLAAQEQAQVGVGQVALEYQQFAWSANGRVATNSYCDVVVGLRTTLPVQYRDDLKEDRDMTLQIIHRGYDTKRISQYAFAAPSNGTNKGGLHEHYAAGRDARWAQRIVDLWPWCSEVKTKPNGRIDAKIHWKKVRQRHALAG